MINERKIAYSEIYTILQMVDPQYLDKIPNRLQKIIIEEMDKNYHSKIVPNLPLKEQGLHERTYAILAMLNLNYWCENQEQKDKLLKIYNDNEKIKNEKLKEKYSLNNILNNNTTTTTNTISLLECKKTIFQKIFDKIKNLFR